MTNSKVFNAQVPTRKVHGHEFPYYKVLMDNGTPCDLLANKPRTTSVLYMCNPRSSNEVRLLSSPRCRHVTCLVMSAKQEQGFWYCFANRLNHSLVSSVAQASL